MKAKGGPKLRSLLLIATLSASACGQSGVMCNCENTHHPVPVHGETCTNSCLCSGYENYTHPGGPFTVQCDVVD